MAEQGVISEFEQRHASVNSSPNWQSICQKMLEQSLPLDSVNTQPGGLRLVNQGWPPYLKIFSTRQRDFRVANRSKTAKTETLPEESLGYTPDQFVEKLLEFELPSSQGKRFAIIGEGGTGKTRFLQYVAQALLNHCTESSVFQQNGKGQDKNLNGSATVAFPQDSYFPIWITPERLKTLSLQDYLLGPWLEQATKGEEQDLEQCQRDFKQLLNTGQVWLLVDGIDFWTLEPEIREENSALSVFQRSLRDWSEPINVIVTCRQETHQLDSKGLAGFDRYQTRALAYPEEVEATIQNWFKTNKKTLETIDLEHSPVSEDLGKQLCQILAESGKAPLRPWLTNPLRLVLCCRFWQERPQIFPKTSAGLYEQLLKQFYQWKAEQLTISSQHQQDLNHQLGELAKHLLLNHQGYTQPISQTDIATCWGEEMPYLRSSLQLGWLLPRGIRYVSSVFPEEKLQSLLKSYYGFFDRSFRDYFAATAIADWHFFLDVTQKSYRIFDPQWQKVLTFWIGRSDIEATEKDALIKALMTFEDHFSEHNFYGKRAFFLATQLLNEFQESGYRYALLTQVKNWSEGKNVEASAFKQSAKMILTQTYRPLVVDLLLTKLKTAQSKAEYQVICDDLTQFGRADKAAIAGLTEKLSTLERQSPHRFIIAETLGFVDTGNPEAIAVFLQTLADPQQEEACQLALSGLSKIAQGNEPVIAAVLDFLGANVTANQQKQALKCLQQIAKGNALAIASLLQRFRVYRESSLRCQTAESLEKIDPGNPTAISVLLHLIGPSQSLEVRKQAIYSLGEITGTSTPVIAALIHLLETDEDIFIAWLAVSSLTKIGQGNAAVIQAFAAFIEESQDNLPLKETGWLIKEVMDALAKIDPTNPTLLKMLVHVIESNRDGEIYQEAAESLGKLDPGNPTAIAVLGQLLKKNEDEFIQRQAAASLGKIDSGNLEALMTLIHLMQNSSNSDVRRLSARSLGAIGMNNAAAIAALIRTALITADKETRRATVQSLGEIAVGNREACQTLMDLLRIQTDTSLRTEIAENLIKILSPKLIPLIIHPLKDALLNKGLKQDMAVYAVFWYCAQHLSYETFYQAWYQLPIDAAPANAQDPLSAIASDWTSPKELPLISLQQSVTQAIAANAPLASLITLIWIDCSQFLEPDDPVIDIYDQMLAQNCPDFENGIPNNLAKLRLYWRLLQRNQMEKTYIWLFDHSAHNCEPFPSEFLDKLNSFQGNIAIISDQADHPLPNFSPQDPQLVEAILDWIKQQISKN
ncbi:MAG: HEAT repeat domain-containing protein [Snowella sp.]|nr:HEAT repeat domain-containing protein [Snowella sp.]